MTDSEAIVTDATLRIFRELGDPCLRRDDDAGARAGLQTVSRAPSDAWRAPLWNTLQEAGLTRAWVDVDLNGAGASMADGFAILRVAGSFAVPVALAETLIGAWLLAQARLPVPDGPLAVAPMRLSDRVSVGRDGALSGAVRGVSFASSAEHIVTACERGSALAIALIERARCQIVAGENVAREASDRVTFAQVRPIAMAAAPDGFRLEHLHLLGAAVRAMQMSGALQAVLERSCAYANERVAFERPIGRFQAIQHALARLAGEVAAAVAAADSAADAIANAREFDADVFLEAAAAKIRIGEAVAVGAGIAHQVHGAIGYSREHVLHRYTQRLWSWRDDFGTEAEWAVRLGERVAANGADALWPWLAAR